MIVSFAVAVACLRIMPLLLWVLIRRDALWAQRLAGTVMFLSGVAFAHAMGVELEELLVRAPIMIVYLACVGYVVAASLPALRRMGRIGQTGILLAAYLGLPAFAGASGYLAPTVAFAWERMLAAYSLCQTPGLTSTEHDVRRHTVFLALDPSLVFHLRAKPVTDDSWKRRGGAMARLGLGCIALAADGMISQRFPALLVVPGVESLWTPLGTLHVAIFSLTTFVALYMAHSGVAHVQIGFARVTGMRLQERYHFPFLARSPLEFWRRWNIWMGVWIKSYVFTPAARSLQRHRVPSGVSLALGVLVSFIATGALHAIATIAILPSTTGVQIGVGQVLAFVSIGCVAILWEGLRRIVRWALPERLLRVAGRLFSNVIFASVFLFVVWMFHLLISGSWQPF